MMGPAAGAIITLFFLFGFRLGWDSDWCRRLFRLGPYKRAPHAPYHFKD
jgi:hypothetical protein